MASHTSAESIRDRAAHWVARLNDNNLSDAERESLQTWLLADPRHATEFRAHNAILGLARDFPSDVQARLGTYVPPDQSYVGSSERRWAWPAALAACALFAVVAVAWIMSQPSTVAPKVYTTKTGESRTVPFDDGSVAYLNTRTQLERLSDSSDRSVRVRDGEVLFDVVHDPAHPFRVVMEDSEIQVLGTRFNVYRKHDGEVAVTVLEGKIQVKGQPDWKRELTANQSIIYNKAGLIQDVQQANGTDATSWRQGVLQLGALTLPEVLKELARYTDKRIVLRSDPRLAPTIAGGAIGIRDVQWLFAQAGKDLTCAGPRDRPDDHARLPNE